MYDALVGGGTNYSNVIFDSSLDGQSIALPNTAEITGSTVPVVVERYVYGNGIDNTVISGFTINARNTTAVTHFDNLRITGIVSTRWIATFNKCKLDNIKKSETSSYPFLSYRITDCLITGNTINNGAFSWTQYNNVVGTTVSNNACRVFGCSYWHTTMDFIDCTFVDNLSPIGISDENENNYLITINSSMNASHDNEYRIENCYFNNPGKVSTNTIRIDYDSSGYTGSRLVISGSTFASTYDGIKVGPSESRTGAILVFEGTNILNSTVSGTGTVEFADGATVSSTLGSGVISTQTLDGVCTNKSLTLEGVMITGATTTGAIFYIGNSGTITLKNCNITGNLTHQLNGGNQGNPVEIDHSSGKAILENVTISGNTTTSQYSSTANSVFCRGGTLYVTSITTSAAITFHIGVAIISGDNTFRFSWASTVDSSCRIVLTPNSIVRTTQSSTTCLGTSMFYVGTYDEATGAITTTGTATVVLNGTTVSISGSGTMIDANGLHS